jgi:hypothetical protein
MESIRQAWDGGQGNASGPTGATIDSRRGRRAVSTTASALEGPPASAQKHRGRLDHGVS